MFTISTIIFLTILYNIYWYYYRKELSLKGKTALITGGSRGIGRICAEKLLENEQVKCVIIWDVDEKSLLECQQALSDKFGKDRVVTRQVDITNREKVYEERDFIFQNHGSVDILINNAGIVNGKKLLDTSDEGIERVFKVNTVSHCFTVKAFLPKMIETKRESHIVTIASAAGICATSGLSDYSASKFGAFGFNEALRMELKHQKLDHIHTVCVCPFYIKTDLFAGIKDVIPYVFPVLNPNYVAGRIIGALKKREEVVILPESLRSVFLLRFLLPVAVFDKIIQLLGISSSMDTFTGRNTH